MEPALKQRLIGAVVISALAIVFLPKFIVGHDKDSAAADVSLQLPGAPERNFETRELPLTTPGATPPGGVVGMNPNAPPLPSPALLAAPAPADANGHPLPADPNAPAVVPAAGANGATPASATLPTTQSALPATPAAATTPAVSTPVAGQPVSTTPGSTTAAALPNTPIPAARAGGNYVVSAGTYSNTANAQSLVSSLKAAQLPAYMEPVTANGKPGMRVRIGPFAQRGDAEAARLHAQQVRTDMTPSVTALDAAAEAPAAKPAVVPTAAAFNSAAGKPAAIKPAVATTPPASTPVVPTPAATATTASNSAAGKPATTAPASPATVARGYVVQVSAFRTEDEALTLRNRLRAAGFTAFSEQVRTDSGILYRVRVGPAADRDAADQMRISLSQKLGLSGMVVAYP